MFNKMVLLNNKGNLVDPLIWDIDHTGRRRVQSLFIALHYQETSILDWLPKKKKVHFRLCQVLFYFKTGFFALHVLKWSSIFLFFFFFLFFWRTKFFIHHNLGLMHFLSTTSLWARVHMHAQRLLYFLG